MENFNKTKAQKIRQELKRALKELETKHDLKISIGNITFDTNEIRTKLTINTKNAPTANEKIKQDYLNYAEVFHLPDIETKVTINNENFDIVGFKNKSRKYPIVIKNQNTNKQYKVSIEQLKNSIKNS